jgi:hypothetical protein
VTSAYSHPELHDLEAAAIEVMLPSGTDVTSGVMVMTALLDREKVSLDDQADTLRLLGRGWRESGDPPELLQALFSSALAASPDPYCKTLAGTYFEVHKKLVGKLAITEEGASQILGYTAVIGALARDQAMSAAQVAGLLRARGVSPDTATWASVREVLSALSLAPKLSAADIEAQLRRDLEGEESRFADADWLSSLELVERLGREMGMSEGINRHLASISPEAGDAHWPYVYMLHFSCTPLDWYDHAPVFIYEFNPRGELATILLAEYAGFDIGANPVLNNAKSVDRIDQNWADSKVRLRLRRPASSLVSLLEEIGALPFQSKRAVGSAIRQWCLRQLRLHRKPTHLLPGEPMSADTISRVLSWAASGETNTRGIIEQRLVDTLARSSHTDPRWRARGLTDSVNAANVPRRKLGDCEFQDSALRRVEAYEAHAGVLSQRYFSNHRSSLSGVLRARLDEEWLAYSDAGEWDVLVSFISHSTRLSDPVDEVIEGVRVRFQFETFEHEIAALDTAPPEFHDALGAMFIDVLNSSNVPQSVRDKVLVYLES